MRIAIVAALSQELIPITDCLKPKEERIKGKQVYFNTTVGENQLFLMTTGIGKVRAAARAQMIIDHCNIDKMIVTGVAGGINPDLKYGDIVISRRTLEHDLSLVASAIYGDQAVLPWYDADVALIELAIKSAEVLGLKDKIHIGSILTGDEVVMQQAKKKLLWETFRGDCVDMESAAVGRVCIMNSIPYVVIRAISDKADEKIFEDFGMWGQKAFEISGKLVLQMIKGIFRFL